MSPPLVAFYGDDFTGSTDVLEVLALAGVPTLLLLEPPAAGTLPERDGPWAVGVAGSSRAMTPSEMDGHLPSALAALAALDAPVLHYKVCSTFDSSPVLGSIGRAIEHGRAVRPGTIPLVVGAPRLGRYTAFGQLFARAGLDSPVYRIDRHPAMARHPSTPMGEADLVMHLARQTELPVGLVDVVAVDRGPDGAAEAFTEVAEAADIVLLDALSDAHLATIGELIWDRRPLFVVGSSGVESALTETWRRQGIVSGARASLPPSGPSEPLVVVSGTASPVTDGQIEHAIEHGFVEIPLETPKLLDERAEGECARAAEQVCGALARGDSAVLHTARGLDDPRIGETRAALTARSLAPAVLGRHLGAILQAILEAANVRRAVVVGGDTSGDVMRALGVISLEAVAELAPGAPICRVRASGAADGLEVVCKGGQVGRLGFLVDARDGTPVAVGKDVSR